jgi:hypothetical protein
MFIGQLPSLMHDLCTSAIKVSSVAGGTIMIRQPPGWICHQLTSQLEEKKGFDYICRALTITIVESPV